jgi:hypothetical protein
MHARGIGLQRSGVGRMFGFLGVSAALFAIAAGPGVSGASAEVTFPGGPLTVSVGPLGQCQSSYASHGNNYYPGFGNLGDCGFFLAFPKENNLAPSGGKEGLQSQTYGFNGFALGGFENTGGLDLFKAVEQQPVTGAGTSASPYSETTIFSVTDALAGSTEYARVTETTTYVNGEAQFTSTYNVKNTSAAKIYFRAMYAGDLYVDGDDHGTGVFLGGPPRFIGGLNTGAGVLGGFQEAPSPALPWTAFQELPWPNVWSTVETTDESPHAFNETIEAAEVDNAAGVEWDQLRAAGLEKGAEQSFTVINRTSVPSNLQISPANQTLTQGQTETITVTALNTANQPYAGKVLHYTVGGANPQSGTVTLNSAGQAQISYVGHNAGIDTTQLYVDLSGSGSQTSSDPSGTATVTFLPLPAPNSSYKVQSIKANSNGSITITFVPTQAGTATLEVTVPTATIASMEAVAAKKGKCKKGQVRIKGKCRAKTTVTGKVSAKGTAGVPLKLTVNASSKIKALLKKGKSVHLTATLNYKSSLGGTPTVGVFHVTAKGHKQKKHH